MHIFNLLILLNSIENWFLEIKRTEFFNIEGSLM